MYNLCTPSLSMSAGSFRWCSTIITSFSCKGELRTMRDRPVLQGRRIFNALRAGPDLDPSYRIQGWVSGARALSASWLAMDCTTHSNVTKIVNASRIRLFSFSVLTKNGYSIGVGTYLAICNNERHLVRKGGSLARS